MSQHLSLPPHCSTVQTSPSDNRSAFNNLNVVLSQFFFFLNLSELFQQPLVFVSCYVHVELSATELTLTLTPNPKP